MIQSIFILSPTGEVLIERHFRGATSRSVCEFYWQKASASLTTNGISGMLSTVSNNDRNESSLHDSVPPILEVSVQSTSGSGSSSSGTLYLFSILRDGLSYLAACPAEVSPLLLLEFLHRVADTFQDYFGTPADEAAMKENFSTVYQLLEEMLDNGWPLTTEPNGLKALIRPPTVMGKLQQAVTGTSYHQVVSQTLPNGTVSNMPWRKAGVRYIHNEIYVDVVEEMDVIVDGVTGRVVSADVSGSVQARSQLSGVPDMLLTFTDPDVIDDCSFHPCVRYQRYDQDKVVSFVPPDGLFELMRYRVRPASYGKNQNMALTPPIFCQPVFHYGTNGGGGGKVNIVVGARPVHSLIFTSKSSAASSGTFLLESVVVTIPFAKSVRTANLTVNYGKVVYDEAAKVAKWNLGRLDEKVSQHKKPQLTGTMVLDTTGGVDNNNNNNNNNNNTVHPSNKNSNTTKTTTTVTDNNPPLQLSWVVPFASVSGLTISGLSMSGESYSPFKGMRNTTKSGSFQVRCH